MKLVRYSDPQHGNLLRGWLWKHGYDASGDLTLSPRGYVFDETAIAFLFDTGTGQMYIDRLATDPEATSEQRDAAIREVLSACEREAKDLGATVVTCISKTEHPHMATRLASLGYANLGVYYLWTKEVQSSPEKKSCRS